MILGVDPGLRGALAVVDPAARRLIAHAPMPIIVVTRRVMLVDHAALAAWLEVHRPARAVIERTAPRPPASLGATETAARLWGSLATVIRTAGVPIDVVDPATWKRAAGLEGRPKRDAIGTAASRLAGADALTDRATGSIEYRVAVAEAALIALVGSAR